MSQIVIFGCDASIFLEHDSPWGAYFSAFSLTISQQIARTVGFGNTSPTKRGTGVIDVSGVVSGYTTYSHDDSFDNAPGIDLIVPDGVPMDFTFATGCVISINAIFSELGLGVQFEGAATSVYKVEGDVNGPNEMWVTR